MTLEAEPLVIDGAGRPPRVLSSDRPTTYDKTHTGQQNVGQTVHIIKKAPSSWRREGSEEAPCRVPRNGSQSRFQVENPHEPKEKRARSTSLNPVIYPQWWGEDHEVDAFYYRRNKNHIPKRLKSADIHKAKVYKPVAKHCEDTLDRRLRQVHEDQQPEIARVAYRYPQDSSGQNDSMQEPIFRTGDSSYAYTQMNNVSPIRPHIQGQSLGRG